MGKNAFLSPHWLFFCQYIIGIELEKNKSGGLVMVPDVFQVDGIIINLFLRIFLNKKNTRGVNLPGV